MSENPKNGTAFWIYCGASSLKDLLAELITNKVGRENTQDIIGPYHSTKKKRFRGGKS